MYHQIPLKQILIETDGEGKTLEFVKHLFQAFQYSWLYYIPFKNMQFSNQVSFDLCYLFGEEDKWI